MAVDLKQYGGEGKEAYSNKKTDATFKQLGGEGKNLKAQSLDKLLKGSDILSPGRNLNRAG